MSRRLATLAMLALGVSIGCSGSHPPTEVRDAIPPRPEIDEPLRTILAAPALARTLAQAESLRLQILLGTIEDDADGRASLKQTEFRADAEYFYPASTVKLFAAVAALERISQLRSETGLDLTIDTPLTYHPQFEETAPVHRDDTNLGTESDPGTITLRHEIRKLFLVSDNEAFNRLYEFVGQDGLHQTLLAAGLPNARIVHRLSEARTAEENRQTPTIDFQEGAKVLFSLPSILSKPLPETPPIAGLQVGNGYLQGSERVDHPMDFSPKNRVSLRDLQRGLCKVVRPDVDCGGGGPFRLSEEDRALTRAAMSEFPSHSKNPLYPLAEFPDSYVKYLLPGLEKALPRERFRIYNKIGQAYGFTTENAWIEDTRTGRGFFLTAMIYTNADGILNDDKYEYATVALPFYSALGEALGYWFWDLQPKKK